ncbi:MAG: hypothetical protein J0L62_07750 [Bacteroidetes bacterium]|nr:hypothetical protein [Bacteroidota bacterium]
MTTLRGKIGEALNMVFQNRFVNQRVLGFICEPKTNEFPILPTLTAAINYLFSNDEQLYTQEQVASILGLNEVKKPKKRVVKNTGVFFIHRGRQLPTPKTENNVNQVKNNELISLFNLFCEKVNLVGNVTEIILPTIADDFFKPETFESQIQSRITDPNKIVIANFSSQLFLVLYEMEWVT